MPAAKYRLYRRSNGTYYQQDHETGTQVSLRTKEKHAAKEKLRAANESVAQPRLNLDLARVYLKAHDAEISNRTWKDVMTVYSERGRDTSRERCRRAFAGRDFDPIRRLLLINTKAEDLLRVLATGKASVNLPTLIHCGGLHAPNAHPSTGLPYRCIHDTEVQGARANVAIDCGPGGVIHDYVPFYFGYLSPMMLKLKTGRVSGYNEGQAPLVYLVTSAQAVAAAGLPFVFSNGHGLAAYTDWFDDLARLDQVDWNMVNQRYWTDNVNDMDRQRRKQAEFLIHGVCPWDLIQMIVVVNSAMQRRVEETLNQFSESIRKPVQIIPSWYY